MLILFNMSMCRFCSFHNIVSLLEVIILSFLIFFFLIYNYYVFLFIYNNNNFFFFWFFKNTYGNMELLLVLFSLTASPQMKSIRYSAANFNSL